MRGNYIELACAILRCQQDAYERALKSWVKNKDEISKWRVLRIESELLTEYYFRLTLGRVNFKTYIDDHRRKYGLPKRGNEEEYDKDWWN